MENQPRAPIRKLIVNPQELLPSMTEERVRMLLGELDMLQDDYERETSIMYLSSNYSTNKHLSFSALRGMHDTEIKQIMEETKIILKEEIKSRRAH